MNPIKIISSTILVLIISLPVSAQEPVQIEVSPGISRAIEGKLTLERNKYFNLSASGTSIESSIASQSREDYYFSDLEMTIGRDLGVVHRATNYGAVREDASRPGYADINYLIQNSNPTNGNSSASFMNLIGANQNIAAHDQHDSYPDFMEKYFIEDVKDKFPENNDAAAELAANVLQYNYTDWTRPAFFEPVNEPGWQFWSNPKFHALHTKIHAAVHDMGLETEVGGPCFSVGYFYKQKYGSLSSITSFIDNTQFKLDFYSYHIYDYMSWNDVSNDFTGSVSSGLPTEGVFDAIANHTVKTYGETFSYVASEHGGYLSNGDKEYIQNKMSSAYFPGSGFSHTMEERSIFDYLAVSSELANTFTFINNPHIVKKAVPFILLETFGWDPTYYASLLVAENFNDKSRWHESRRIHFYEFFKDVRGRRILSNCPDNDIQHHAFVDGSTLILIFNNQSNVENSLSFNIDDFPGEIKDIMLRRHGKNPDLRPYLSEERLFNLGNLKIGKREALALFIEYDRPIAEEQIFNEIVHYGDRIGQQFSGSRTYHVSTPDFANAQYAILRVGIGLGENDPKEVNISINGTALDIPVEDMAPRLEPGDYGTTRIIKIDAALLQADNTVQVEFPAGTTGGVGAVVLRVAYLSSDALSSIDISQDEIEIYENQTLTPEVRFLPETSNEKALTWSSMDDATATVSADGQVRGIMVGSTRIIAQSAAGSFSDTLIVNVKAQNLVSNADKSGWTVIYADDEGTIQGMLKENAIDDDLSTYWHTEWLVDPLSGLPHEIWVDMGDTLNFDSFIYTPRQDQWGPNGTIGDYELYFSNDTGNWGSAYISGTFTWNTAEDSYYKEIQKIALPDRVEARFFRLVALTEHQNIPEISHTAAAELDVASELTGIAFSKDTIYLSLGATQYAEINTLPLGNSIQGEKLRWYSEEKRIIDVSEGMISGEGAGLTKVYAETFDGSFRDSMLVKVSIVPVDELLLSESEISMILNEHKVLSAQILPANAYYDSYFWASDNESVASVNKGYVTANDYGSANIIVTSSDSTHTDTCKVSVMDIRYNLNITVLDDDSGNPIEDAEVTFAGETRNSDASGAVSFSNISRGTHSVLIKKRHYVDFAQNIALEADMSLNLRMDKRSYRVDISVKESATGGPIADAAIQIGTTNLTTGALGTSYAFLLPGSYSYSVSQNYFSPLSADVSIQNDTTLALEMDRNFADLKFRLSDSAGILSDVSLEIGGHTGKTNTVGTYTFYKLKVDTTYNYSAKKSGYEDFNAQLSLRTDSTVNIFMEELLIGMEENTSESLKIYPNPARETLNIKALPGTFVQLINLEGSIIESFITVSAREELSLLSYAPGMYLIRITSAKKVLTAPFVVLQK